MNLHRLLSERAAEDRPVRVGLIGAGKFGSMFLAQARRTVGLHILGIADLARVGWPDEQVAAPDFAVALKSGATHVSEDAAALIAAPGLDVVIDATGQAVCVKREMEDAFAPAASKAAE